MTARKKASQQGARRVSASLDSIADLFTHHAESLGVSEKVAKDFAHRCDLLSDHLDRQRTAGYFNPAEIGEQHPGPMIMDPNNPFMSGHFTQDKFVELAEKQMSGSLAQNAAAHTADPVRLAKIIAKEAGKLAFNQLKEWDAKKAKKAEDEPAEEETDKEAKKAEDAPEDDKKSDDEMTEEASKKAASTFGLFATK